MRIAILGWRSLIWSPGRLAYNGTWMRNGPTLPIEFSRISGDGRLTLVIDIGHGSPVITRYAESSRRDLPDAIRDLRDSEGTITEMIGFVDLVNNADSISKYPQQPDVCKEVAAWCKGANFDAAIWTALPPQFEENAHMPSSADNAIRHLQSLNPAAKKVALEYINNAPEEVDTPVRRKLNQVGQI
jgi:hypothetical protein